MPSNNIYTFQNVIIFLQSINADQIYHTKREWYIKSNHTELHSKIYNDTYFLENPTFRERLFCYANNITSRQSCVICENSVTYDNHKKCYHTYCSQRCSMLDMKSLIGVDNASQLQSVKEQKKQKSIEKYGVDNVSKSTEIKEILSKKRVQQWKNYYNNKDFTINDLTKTQYRNRCQQYLNTQYNKNKHIIDPENKRGNEWHIDHIYSVSDGFINNVPINVISDISNLRLISAKENYQKFTKSGKTLKQLYDDYYTTVFENS